MWEILPFPDLSRKAHENVDITDSGVQSQVKGILCPNFEFLECMLIKKQYHRFIDTVANYMSTSGISKDEIDASIFCAFQDNPEGLLNFYHDAYHISSNNNDKYTKIFIIIAGTVKEEIIADIGYTMYISPKTCFLFDRVYNLYKKEEEFIQITWVRKNFLFSYINNFIGTLLSLYLSRWDYHMIVYFLSSNIENFYPFRETIFNFINRMDQERNLLEWSSDAKAIEIARKELCRMLHLITKDEITPEKLRIIHSS